MFAFKTPNLKKFITAEKSGEGLRLKSYKIIGDGKSCVLKDEMICADKKKIITFSGNIEHFVFLGDADKNLLPFKPEFELSSAEFKPSEIIVWLRENPVEKYVAPTKKVSERLKNLGVEP
ncbi:MAG: hypothetical protein K6G55_06570 [Selenomonadaceae bacterium]|nr:hypothetical protein [Selenomonadaceae bacterium]